MRTHTGLQKCFYAELITSLTEDSNGTFSSEAKIFRYDSCRSKEYFTVNLDTNTVEITQVSLHNCMHVHMLMPVAMWVASAVVTQVSLHNCIHVHVLMPVAMPVAMRVGNKIASTFQQKFYLCQQHTVPNHSSVNYYKIMFKVNGNHSNNYQLFICPCRTNQMHHRSS